MNEPEIKSYVVFVERPPKKDGKQFYTVMEISYTDTDKDVELLIASHVNEKRLNPMPPGLISYMIVTVDTAQKAANQARVEGLVYLSVDEIRRIKAEKANAEKFGQSRQNEPFKTNDGFGKPPWDENHDPWDILFGKQGNPFSGPN